uniref:Uncharacterized protein n=1 Tax=Anguilla anguilla TaxID=7936 RepID=A0A0E9Q833_ANGAN
MHSFRLLAFVK